MRRVGGVVAHLQRRRIHSPVDLNHITIQPAEGKRVDGLEPFVVVHGMLGNAQNWRTPARILADETGRLVHCVDMRNHGASPRSDVMSYHSLSNDMLAFIESEVVDHEKAILLGHSLGGKAVMQAALRHPETLAGLIVADIAPVDYNKSSKSKAISQSTNYIKLLIDMPEETMLNLTAADAYLEAHGVCNKGVRQFLLTNLRRCSKSKTASWKANLDVLHNNLTDGTLVGFETGGNDVSHVPTLILTGGLSPYVKMHRDGEVFDTFFPNNTHVEMPAAGHWLHSQQPKEFAEHILEWVEQL